MNPISKNPYQQFVNTNFRRTYASQAELDFKDYLPAYNRHPGKQPPRNLSDLREVVSDPAFRVNCMWRDCDRPLILLAKYGKPTQLVEDFVRKGVNFNLRDPAGNTALHWAIANANYAMALEILERGDTNLNIRDHYLGGNTPLTLVLAQGYTKTDGDGRPLLVPYQVIVRKLIEKGADITLSHHATGITPLELALCHRDIEIAELLTPRGFDKKQVARFRNMSFFESRQMLKQCYAPKSFVQTIYEWIPRFFIGEYESRQKVLEDYLAKK